MEEQTKNSRLTQEAQPINPIEKNRHSTDKFFIFVFLFIAIAWVAIGISALCAAPPRNPHSDSTQAFLYIKALINAPVKRFSLGLVVEYIALLVLCTGIPLFCIFQSGNRIKFFYYLGTGIYMLATISIFFKFILGYVKEDNRRKNPIVPPVLEMFFNGLVQMWYIAKAIFMIVCFSCFLKADQNVLRNIIKDFSRVVRDSPLLILFSGFILILECLVFSFTMNATINELMSDHDIHRVVSYFIVLMLGGLCVLSFLNNFAFMVISDYTVNYYWRNDEATIKQSIVQILRNHIGTTMFSSILCIPFITGIVQALKHKPSWKNTEKYIYYFVSKVSLVLDMDCTALIFSSIHGTGFTNSAQRTFETVLRRCYLYLATLGVIDAVLVVIMTIISISTGILLVIVGLASGVDFKDEVKAEAETTMLIATAAYAFLIPFLTFLLLMYSSSRAILTNKIIMLNKEEQYTEGKTEILNRL